MDTILNYLIRSIVVSGLLLGYYQLLLRNRKQHRFNRAFLLSTLLASVVLPLIRVGWLSWHTGGNRPLEVLMTGGATRPAAGPAFPWAITIAALAVAISLSFLVVLAIRVLAVYRLRQRHGAERLEDYLLIRVADRRAPFSFFNNLFWQQGAEIDDPVHRRILDHELTHIRGRHTYDTVFAQLVAAVFWMNPFYWTIRREIAMVHEFIADEASLAAGDSEGFARMLLQAYDDGRYLDPSHRFFHSPIKRRLTMITRTQRPARWGRRLALPVLMAVMTLSCSKEDGLAQKTPPPPPQQVAIKALKFKFTQFKFTQLKVRKDSLAHIMLDDVRQVYNVTVVGSNNTKPLHYSFSSKEDVDKLTQGVSIQGVSFEKARIVPDNK